MKNFWYFDKDGIMSLAAQCQKYIEDGRVTSEKQFNGRKSKLKLAVAAIAAIFGSAKIAADIETTTSVDKENTSQFKTTPEQHLNTVLEFLRSSNQLIHYSNIDQLVRTDYSEFPLFCTGNFDFLLDSDYYLENENSLYRSVEKKYLIGTLIEFVQKKKFMLFKAIADNYALDQSIQFENVLLGASLEKVPSACICVDGRVKIKKTSHLALILRNCVCSKINIDFFGHVTPSGKSLYIKPYAIWTMAGL